MAKFNELLSPRFNNLASRFLPVDEQEGVQTLSPDLQLVVDLHGDADLRYLLGERLCAGYATAGAGAGVYSSIALRNPSGANILCILEQFNIHSVGNFRFGIFDAAGTAVTTTGFRDSRLGVTRRPAAQVTQNAVASLPSSPIGGYIVTATTNDAMRVHYVIAPGLAFVIEHGTVNTAFTVGFVWRERVIQPGELV